MAKWGEMSMRTALTVAALLMAAACSAREQGPPEIAVDRTVCSGCGMLISEKTHAAAYQAPGREARVFDDIGCLRRAAALEAAGLRFWFQDAAGAGWIDGREATFVASPEFRTPMGGGMLAFRDAAAAAESARTHRGEAIGSLAALLMREDERR